jgi:hypothetical protein
MELIPINSDPVQNALIGLTNSQIMFIENEKTVRFSKMSLEQWLNKDMDRVFSQNSSEAQKFYDDIHRLICEFEAEQNHCQNHIKVGLNKAHVLFNVIYPDTKDLVNTYFNTIANLTQNAKFVGNVPKLPPLKQNVYLDFYDRYQHLCKELLNSIRTYNNKVVELDKMRTLNHHKILNNGWLMRFLSQDNTTLRKIFNSMQVHKIVF